MHGSGRPGRNPAMLAMAAALMAGCTPLGIWVYDEPAVTVSAISFTGDSTALVEVTLQVRNPNDFDIKLEQVELYVSLGGQALIDTSISATLTLLYAERRDITLNAGRQTVSFGNSPEAMRSGRHGYLVRGEARLSTPIGIRRIPFQQEGKGEWVTSVAPAPQTPH